MFCTKCGMKNDDDALFCAGCGSVMSNAQPAQPQTNGSFQPQAEQSAQPLNSLKSQTQENAQPQQDDGVWQQGENGEQTQSVSLEKPQAEENGAENVSFESITPTEEYAQSQSFGQSQFSGQPQNMSQSSFGSQPQGFGQPQFSSETQNFGQPQFANPQPVNGKKFSVKRFIFSALIIIASILACACVAFNFVGIKINLKVQGETSESDKEYIKGYRIIKNNANVDLLDADELEDEDSAKFVRDLSDTAKQFRIAVIIFEVALVVFTIIDLILLTIVRKRAAYVFTMVFALIKAAIGGVAIWLWCFKFLDIVRDFMETMMEDYLSYGFFTMRISALVGIGFILAMAMQAVVAVCSIVLLTCKNRQKGLPQA